MTLDTHEFIRRFLMHVLSDRLVASTHIMQRSKSPPRRA